MKCKKCGMSYDGIITLAMIETMGGKCFPSSVECSGGGKHDFEDTPKVKQEAK